MYSKIQAWCIPINKVKQRNGFMYNIAKLNEVYWPGYSKHEAGFYVSGWYCQTLGLKAGASG